MNSPAILLVDDEFLVRAVGSMSLERRGYEVMVAPGGFEGLRMFREHRDRIDLVIADIRMPDMSGPEMAEIMRRECPHLSVLFISGQNDELPAWVTETCGLLRKPFLPREFVAKVEDCLGPKPKAAVCD